MKTGTLGFLVALVTLGADQASKLWLLFRYRILEQGPFALGPYIEVTAVWNRGISYGLFQQHSDFGRWLLIGLSLLAALGFCVWLWRGPTRIVALALGLLIGGALGNAYDRIVYGAVFDFLHIHVGDFSWYVFNVADAAIVAGVVALLYDAVMPSRDGAGKIAPAGADRVEKL